ncbi:MULTISPECIES: YidH family protein [Falsihalocynthiibacter]|uniref:YidH family protein n=1 Tax=Falsihalocynthiibacter TaxID=2854182 RepID=UPI003002E0EF
MTELDAINPAEIPLTTRLALERTRIAYERTMMAWVRTAASFITFGFSVYKFFDIETAGQDIGPSLIGHREFAALLIGMGLLTLLVGKIEHGRDLRALGKYYTDMPVSGTRVIALLVALAGAISFVAVLLGA